MQVPLEKNSGKIMGEVFIEKKEFERKTETRGATRWIWTHLAGPPF
jgi:hypothetical protein